MSCVQVMISSKLRITSDLCLHCMMGLFAKHGTVVPLPRYMAFAFPLQCFKSICLTLDDITNAMLHLYI